MFISKKKYKSLLTELENSKNVVDERRVHYTELQMQEYRSRISINREEEVPFEYIQGDLSRLLTEELLKAGAIEFYNEASLDYNKIVYTATLKVLRKRGTIE